VAASKKCTPSAGFGCPSIGDSIARSLSASSRVIGLASALFFPIITPRSAMAA
jgi:hypothetical protein